MWLASLVLMYYVNAAQDPKLLLEINSLAILLKLFTSKLLLEKCSISHGKLETRDPSGQHNYP